MAFTQGHALLIGVGTHLHHPNLDVPITISDAQAVKQTLEDRRTCGYPPEQVRCICGNDATKEDILHALEALANTTGTDGTAFLHFCGHGALGTDGDYYLVTHDARVQGSRILAGTGISEGELLEKLRAIRAQRVLMLFNACHAGSLSPVLDLNASALDTSNPPADSSMALLGTGQGRIIITACREAQVSYIGDEAITIFTGALVDGLRGTGVRNSRGFVSAFSLYEHIYESVTETVRRRYHMEQEPELTVLKGVGPFAVSLYKGATTLGEFDDREPVPEGTAVREVLPEKAARFFERRVIQSRGGLAAAGNMHVATVAGRNNIGAQIGDIGAGAQVAIGKQIRQTRGKDE